MSDADKDKDFGPFIGGLKVQRSDKPQKPNPPPEKFHTMRRCAPNPGAPVIETSSGPANQGHTASNVVPLQGLLIGSLAESQEGESIKPGSSVPQNIMDAGLDNEKDLSWKPLVASPSEKPHAESESMELVSLSLPSRAARDPADMKGKTVVPNNPFTGFFENMTRPRSLGTENDASSAQSSALVTRRLTVGTQSNAPSALSYADVLRRPTLGAQGITPPVSQPSVALTRPVYLGTMKSLTSVPSGSGLTRPVNLRARRNTSVVQHVPSILDDPIDDLGCPMLAPITPVTSAAAMTSQGTLATTNAPSVPGGVAVTSPGNLGNKSNVRPVQRVSIRNGTKDDLDLIFGPLSPGFASSSVTSSGISGSTSNVNPVQRVAVLDDARNNLDWIFGPIPPVTASGVASPGNLGGMSHAQPTQRVSILDDTKNDLDLIFGPFPSATASSAFISSGTSGSTSNANPAQRVSILDDTKNDLELIFGPKPLVPASSAVTTSGTLGNTSSARPVQRTTNIMDRQSPLDRVLFGSTAPVSTSAAVISSGNQEKQKRRPWVLRGSDVTGDDSLEDKPVQPVRPVQPSAGIILDLDTPLGDPKTQNKAPSATRYSDSFLELQEAFKNMDLSRENTTPRRSSAPNNYDDGEWVFSGPGPHRVAPKRQTRPSNDLNTGSARRGIPDFPVTNIGSSNLLEFSPPKSLASANRTGDSELSDKDEISGFIPRGARHATCTDDVDEQGSEKNGPPSRDSSMGGFQTPTTSEGDNQGVVVPQNDNEE